MVSDYSSSLGTKKTGTKVIIGDNLSSHLNLNLVIECQRAQIRFVFLPPKPTHLAQPLDVGYYGPLKRCWGKLLTTYKLKNPKEKTVNKIPFSVLLKQLVKQLSLNDIKNIQSAFRTTCIIPINRLKVLQKLPNYRAQENIGAEISDTLLEFLKKTRTSTDAKVPKRKKMVRVELGKSVSDQDFLEAGPSKSTDGLYIEKNAEVSETQ